MALSDLLRAVNVLSREELDQLYEYIEQLRERQEAARGATPEERIRRLNAAAHAIRDGFSEQEWEEVVDAINVEYIEPFDDEQWKD